MSPDSANADTFHTWRKGWTAATSCRAMDPTISEHAIEAIREEYKRGYEEGIKDRREACATAAKRLGYKPTPFRGMKLN